MSDHVDVDDFSLFESQLLAGLRTVFSSGKWLAVGEGANPAIGLASRIVETSGRRPEDVTMALSAFGAYDHGSQPGIDHIGLGLPTPPTLLQGIHQAQNAYLSLPEPAQARINQWDPEGIARAVLPFTSTAASVGGRSSFGVTRETWKQLEDKLAVVELWREAGIEQAPCEMVDLTDERAGLDAHDRLATGQGSVWAVDNRSGWHGGADGTFWVRTRDDVTELMRSRSGHNDHARVMPFLAGVPCSIHGMVFADRTISFIPCEMMTFLDLDGRRFHYGRSGTFWRPPGPVHARMREAAEAVGDALRHRVGFRGVFTLDGVADERSFRPTEVNPRFGAALPMLHSTSSGEQLSMFLLHVCVVEDALPTVDPQMLEQWVRSKMSERPEARLMTPVERSPGDNDSVKARINLRDRASHTVAPEDVQFIEIVDAAEGHHPDDGHSALGLFEWVPRGAEGLAFIHVESDGVDPGPPLAPTALAILQAADRRWDIGLANLVPACTAS